MELTGDVADLIVCPTCREHVEQTEAGVLCRNGHLIPLRNGYLDALAADPSVCGDVDTRRTASSFGYEWTTFDAIEPEDAEYWKMYFRDVPVEAYAGKVVLDAGCGKARYSFFTAQHARALVAADNSDAVEVAARNLNGLPSATVVKADIRNLPFTEDGFGFISCLGVLHHLREPEAAFASLVKLLEPGGHLLLYVYSRDHRRNLRSFGLAASTALRRLTVRLPHRTLRTISAPVAGLLYGLVVVPGQVGSRLAARPLAGLPLAPYRGKPVRSLWLDTFDRLSAPIEHRYDRDEVQGWFARSGLTVLACREEAGLFVFGQKV